MMSRRGDDSLRFLLVPASRNCLDQPVLSDACVDIRRRFFSSEVFRDCLYTRIARSQESGIRRRVADLVGSTTTRTDCDRNYTTTSTCRFNKYVSADQPRVSQSDKGFPDPDPDG